MADFTKEQLAGLAEAALQSRKYRALDLPPRLIWNLLEQESHNADSIKVLEKNFREKLHQIVAPYLETTNYPQELKTISSLDHKGLAEWSLRVMGTHDSTKERLPILPDFYTAIWRQVPKPNSLLDLACGLHPFGLPWMGLPADCAYLAYDIHRPRVELLNAYFSRFFPNAKAIHQDILVEPAETQADVAFFFKEAHRLERRSPGATARLIRQTPAKVFVISLPATDLKGHHSLEKLHTELVLKAISGLDYSMVQDKVGNELLYFLERQDD